MKPIDRAMVFVMAYALLMPLIVGVVACWPEMPAALRRAASPPAAAWVQAFGSVAAILFSTGVAIGVPLHMHRLQTKDQIQRAVMGLIAVFAQGQTILQAHREMVISGSFDAHVLDLIQKGLETAHADLPLVGPQHLPAAHMDDYYIAKLSPWIAAQLAVEGKALLQAGQSVPESLYDTLLRHFGQAEQRLRLTAREWQANQ